MVSLFLFLNMKTVASKVNKAPTVPKSPTVEVNTCVFPAVSLVMSQAVNSVPHSGHRNRLPITNLKTRTRLLQECLFGFAGLTPQNVIPVRIATKFDNDVSVLDFEIQIGQVFEQAHRLIMDRQRF